jgi:DNA polymerase-1
LKQMSKKLSARLGELEASIHEMVGYTFNINSTQQLSDALFKALELPSQGLRRTKSGHFSTAASVLERLRGKHPVIDLILEQRGLAKLKSTYVDALPQLVNPIFRTSPFAQSWDGRCGEPSSLNRAGN